MLDGFMLKTVFFKIGVFLLCRGLLFRLSEGILAKIILTKLCFRHYVTNIF